jgi:hypothetical protein
MGFFKNLFKRKEKEPTPEPELEVTDNTIQCAYCHGQILDHEKRSKIKGQRFHKRCYKKLKKETLKNLYGGRPT